MHREAADTTPTARSTPGHLRARHEGCGPSPGRPPPADQWSGSKCSAREILPHPTAAGHGLVLPPCEHGGGRPREAWWRGRPHARSLLPPPPPPSAVPLPRYASLRAEGGTRLAARQRGALHLAQLHPFTVGLARSHRSSDELHAFDTVIEGGQEALVRL